MVASGPTLDEAHNQLVEIKDYIEVRQNNVDALPSELKAAEQRRLEAEDHGRIARENHIQLEKEETNQKKALAISESRKSSAEIKLSALTSEFEHLLAEGANSSGTTQEIEQEIQSQESAL